MTSSRRLAALLALAGAIASPRGARAEGRPIQDNSFLIEEAYNQEAGVIQHINTFARTRGGAWGYSFTEEWPVLGQTHQASVTFTAAGPEGASAGVGDLALNYRLQAIGNGETRVALSPRLTVLVPTGDSARGLGSGGTGLQLNVPLSVVLLDRLVTHVNVGATYVPSARDGAGAKGSSASFAAGESFIWLAHTNFNVMLEALYTRTELSFGAGRQRTETFTVSPGLRTAINFRSGLQIVPGIAVPIGVGPSAGERSVFLYLSFEHPFRAAGPTEQS
ncbi:MAG TPA: hypothetical protein VF912_10025 [Anaeromyxobacter sp.]